MTANILWATLMLIAMLLAFAGAKDFARTLREQRKAFEDEIHRLHRRLASETLRADQGWDRWAVANKDRNDLRAEKTGTSHE